MKYNIDDVRAAFLKAAPFPPMLFRVVAILKDPKTSMFKLGRELAKEPVLSAKLLAAANSPYYGVKQKISDLPHAISLMGVNDVSAIVMRQLSKQTLSKNVVRPSRLYSAKHIWMHSVKVAHLARMLARRNNLPFVMECYMAGLLHDVGKNAIAVCIKPDDENEIIKDVEAGKEIHEAETRVLGFDHTQCGFQILKHMKMSLDILQGVRGHHDKMAKDFLQIRFVLALAEALSDYDPEDGADRKELEIRLARQFDMTSNDIPGLDDMYAELKIDMQNL